MGLSLNIPSFETDEDSRSWVADLLASNGIKANVDQVTAEPIGTGQMAHNLRLRIVTSDGNPECPETLVVKLPSPNELSRKSGNGPSGFYTREVNFYQKLAVKTNIRTPHCYYAAQDESGFAIVLEDLAPACQGDQIIGVSIEQAKLAIVEAAKLHASYWADPLIDTLPWVSGAKAAPDWTGAGASMARLWAKFCSRYSDRISEETKEVGDRFIPHFDRFLAGRNTPKCLIHNDYRPDNMMFATPEGGHPLTVVDWQTVGFGHAASDLSYFLAGSVSPDVRKDCAEGLLRKYHEVLTGLGVQGFTFDELFEDFRFYSFQLFYSAVIGAMVTESTQRGDDMFFVMVEGATQQVLDLDALSMLE